MTLPKSVVTESDLRPPQLSTLSLDKLAEQISEDVAAAEVAYQSAVRYALRAGKALIEAKSRVERGKWLDWLDANLPDLSVRTAQLYMRFARNTQRVAHLGSIREAVAELTESSESSESDGESRSRPEVVEVELLTEPNPEGRTAWSAKKMGGRVFAECGHCHTLYPESSEQGRKVLDAMARETLRREAVAEREAANG
jgi:hypothetical protein